MKLTGTESNAIKQKLLFGDIALIAKMANTSYSTVWRWLNCDSHSTVIPHAIDKLFKHRENVADSLRETLKK